MMELLKLEYKTPKQMYYPLVYKVSVFIEWNLIVPRHLQTLHNLTDCERVLF